MKKKERLEIVELFMFRAGTDWKRTFTGQIIRDKTDDGKDIVYGRVDVGGCRVIGCAENQDQLGLYLDDACTLILDYKIHEKQGVKIMIIGSEFHLN